MRPTRSRRSCYAYEAPYAMSKAAVIHLTQCLANENGNRIRVNCVSPGWVKTPMESPSY